MEKILLINSLEGKNNAYKLQQALKKEGYAVTLGASRIDQDKKLPELVIAVFTTDSDSDNNMMNVLSGCSERDINVIPFVSCNFSKSVTHNFYLDEHIWIDNIETPFDESAANLVDLLKKNYSELSQRTGKKKDFKKQNAVQVPSQKSVKNSSVSDKEKLFKNLLYLAAAIIIVLLLLLVSGGFNQTNREADNYRANSQVSNGNSNSDVKIQLSSELKNSEKNLVGTWKMVSYTDNQFRPTKQDSLEIQAMVNSLISRAQLIFNSDKTFERLGFSSSKETGIWEYDPQSKYLKLQPTNANQFDVVQLQELTENQLIIVVQEKVNDNEVFTKLTFQKVN